MIKITTTSVQRRADWYQAHAKIGERYYNEFARTRLEAFMTLAWQLHNLGAFRLRA